MSRQGGKAAAGERDGGDIGKPPAWAESRAGVAQGADGGDEDEHDACVFYYYSLPPPPNGQPVGAGGVRATLGAIKLLPTLNIGPPPPPSGVTLREAKFRAAVWPLLGPARDELFAGPRAKQ